MKPVVIITGGTKGLGRETALAFGRAGYYVLTFFSADVAAASQLEAEFAEAAIQGCVFRHDVCVENAAIWNRPEILCAENLTFIHNACAPFSPVPMHQLAWRDFESAFNVAVKGDWLCSQALIRVMLKKKRGTIVNILSSAVTDHPPKGFAAYLTAKHALRGLTLALAAEYAPRGVRVFSASPGFMDTSLTAQWDVRLREAMLSSTRITKPAEAAVRLLQLVEDVRVVGHGEDYPL